MMLEYDGDAFNTVEKMEPYEHLLPILDASFDAGLLLDTKNGSILHVNTGARDFLGIRHPEHQLVTDALIFLEKQHHAPQSWDDLQSLQQSTISVVCKRDSVVSGEARLATVGMYYILWIRPQEECKLTPHVLAGILEAALDPLFQVNEQGIIQMVNKAATTQFGWTREEFLGRNISMIVGAEHGSKHDAYMQRYLTTGERKVMGTKRELPARRKDGSEFIIQLSLVEVNVPVEHGDERMFCGFILDLTEQKRLIFKIKQERNLVQSILNASLDPLFQVNEKGIIQMVNKAATTQFGWTQDEFIGNNISMIVGREHADKHDAYMERYLRTGETRVMGTKRILPARRKDGSEFTIQLSLVEVDVPVEHGKERMFCGFILDVSDQQMLQSWISQFPGFRNRYT
jgi:PAS domain S-box-containing protein